ncbi:MAG: helix-turn-helix domain-containing protein [Alphaproteobacteria bacterium]|nr:helix-turn-helix domain-containing protein [Alphaproteobacteria bacterium]
MITGRQIRAARALLDMSQEELAKAAGLTKQAISKIEDGSVQPREGTLADIRRVFDEKGIEFTENTGVRFRPEDIRILNGREGLIALMEDIYETCRKGDVKNIVLAGAPEDDFERVLGSYDAEYLTKMSSISGLKMRTLIREGDTNVVSSAYTEYRWAPKDQFQPVPFYAYGDKLAIIVFHADPAPRIYMIQSKIISDAYRQQFESMWESAKPVKIK